MVTAIIAAAGQGKRMGKGMNKVFIPIFNRPLLTYTLDVFEAYPEVRHIVLVAGAEDLERVRAIVESYGYQKFYDIVPGGAERQHSIANALKKVPAETRTVLIHDGARPLITGEIIERALQAVQETGAVGVAVPVKDTIKVADEQGFVLETPDRSKLWAMQTPQVFQRDIIEQAYHKAEEEGFLATDDAGLVERMGIKIKLVMGDYANLKVTTPEDLLMAEAILRGKT